MRLLRPGHYLVSFTFALLVKKYRIKREIGNKLKILFASILVQNSNILFVPFVRKFVVLEKIFWQLDYIGISVLCISK
jgi:hypothetical protein